MRGPLTVVKSVERGETLPGSAGTGRSRREEGCGSGLFGVETGLMSPGARVAAALAVLAPVMLSGVFLVVFVPQLWWIFTTYGWVSFPAYGLLASGLAGLAARRSGERRGTSSAGERERELLDALKRHGELTPARAAMETSLTVAEADRKLKELAEAGHLEVRVRGGGLFYALWEPAPDASLRDDRYLGGEA